MTNVRDQDEFDALEERAKFYSGHLIVGDIRGRALGLELTWANFSMIRETEDVELATGALRACIGDAIRLAATPASSAEEATKKIRGLRRARERLTEMKDPRDPVKWDTLLSAALAAEAARWHLSDDELPDDADEDLARRRARNKLSSSIEASYRSLAKERTFSSAQRDVASIEADIDRLVGVNGTAVEGARFELLVATLQAAATSVISQEELAAKLEILRRDPDLLAPVWMIQPMVEAVIAEEIQVIYPPKALP